MKAVVLAGGYATRLWPITRHRPKMLLPLGETTIIDRVYSELEAFDRIDEVYVSTNERFVEAFETHLTDTPYEKPQLSVEDTTAEGVKLGVVGGLERLVEREGISDDLLVVAGDNVFDSSLRQFLDQAETYDAPTIGVYDVEDPASATAYGIVEVDGDRVVAFHEKPEEPPGTTVSTGCYVFPLESLELLSTYLEAGNDPDEPGWFIAWLQSRHPTYVYPFDGSWFDIGTIGSYLDAVSWSLDGDNRIARSASIENSDIGPNVHIMDDVTLADTQIERAVIFPSVTLVGTTVSGSVVDIGARWEDIPLENGLIGAYTRVPGDKPVQRYEDDHTT